MAGYFFLPILYTLYGTRAECIAIITIEVTSQVCLLRYNVQIRQRGKRMREDEKRWKRDLSVTEPTGTSIIGGVGTQIFGHVLYCSVAKVNRTNVPILSLKTISEDKSRQRPKNVFASCLHVIRYSSTRIFCDAKMRQIYFRNGGSALDPAEGAPNGDDGLMPLASSVVVMSRSLLTTGPSIKPITHGIM